MKGKQKKKTSALVQKQSKSPQAQSFKQTHHLGHISHETFHTPGQNTRLNPSEPQQQLGKEICPHGLTQLSKAKNGPREQKESNISSLGQRSLSSWLGRKETENSIIANSNTKKQSISVKQIQALQEKPLASKEEKKEELHDRFSHRPLESISSVRLNSWTFLQQTNPVLYRLLWSKRKDHEWQAKEAARRLLKREKNLTQWLTLANPAHKRVCGSKGETLPHQIRRHLETYFRVDLSSIQLHRDQKAHEATQRARTRAFAAGAHIYLHGMPSLEELPSLLELLAHETAHVIQQTGYRTPQGKILLKERYGSGLPQQDSGPKPKQMVVAGLNQELLPKIRSTPISINNRSLKTKPQKFRLQRPPRGLLTVQLYGVAIKLSRKLLFSPQKSIKQEFIALLLANLLPSSKYNLYLVQEVARKIPGGMYFWGKHISMQGRVSKVTATDQMFYDVKLVSDVLTYLFFRHNLRTVLNKKQLDTIRLGEAARIAHRDIKLAIRHDQFRRFFPGWPYLSGYMPGWYTYKIMLGELAQYRKSLEDNATNLERFRINRGQNNKGLVLYLKGLLKLFKVIQPNIVVVDLIRKDSALTSLPIYSRLFGSAPSSGRRIASQEGPVNTTLMILFLHFLHTQKPLRQMTLERKATVPGSPNSPRRELLLRFDRALHHGSYKTTYHKDQKLTKAPSDRNYGPPLVSLQAFPTLRPPFYGVALESPRRFVANVKLPDEPIWRHKKLGYRMIWEVAQVKSSKVQKLVQRVSKRPYSNDLSKATKVKQTEPIPLFERYLKTQFSFPFPTTPASKKKTPYQSLQNAMKESIVLPHAKLKGSKSLSPKESRRTKVSKYKSFLSLSRRSARQASANTHANNKDAKSPQDTYKRIFQSDKLKKAIGGMDAAYADMGKQIKDNLLEDLGRAILGGKTKNKTNDQVMVDAYQKRFGPPGSPIPINRLEDSYTILQATTIVVSRTIASLYAGAKAAIKAFLSPATERRIPFPRAGMFIVRFLADPIVRDNDEFRPEAGASYLPVNVYPTRKLATASGNMMQRQILRMGQQRILFLARVRRIRSKLKDIQESFLKLDKKKRAKKPYDHISYHSLNTQIHFLSQELAKTQKEEQQEKLRFYNVQLKGNVLHVLRLRKQHLLVEKRKHSSNSGQLKEIQKQIEQTEEQIRLYLKHIGESRSILPISPIRGIGSDGKMKKDFNPQFTERIQVQFVSEETQSTMPLLIELVPQSQGKNQFQYKAYDFSHKVHSAEGPVEKSRYFAIVAAVKTLLDDSEYGRGYASILVPWTPYSHRTKVKTIRVSPNLKRINMEAIENITSAVTTAALVASATTGAPLAFLSYVGALGSIPSGIRLYERAHHGTLDFGELRTWLEASDLVGGIAGFALARSVAGAAKLGAGASRATFLKNYQRLAVLAANSSDVTSIVLAAGQGLYLATRLDPNLPPGEYRSRLVDVLSGLANISLMKLAGLLSTRAQMKKAQQFWESSSSKDRSVAQAHADLLAAQAREKTDQVNQLRLAGKEDTALVSQLKEMTPNILSSDKLAIKEVSSLSDGAILIAPVTDLYGAVIRVDVLVAKDASPQAFRQHLPELAKVMIMSGVLGKVISRLSFAAGSRPPIDLLTRKGEAALEIGKLGRMIRAYQDTSNFLDKMLMGLINRLPRKYKKSEGVDVHKSLSADEKTKTLRALYLQLRENVVALRKNTAEPARGFIAGVKRDAAIKSISGEELTSNDTQRALLYLLGPIQKALFRKGQGEGLDQTDQATLGPLLNYLEGTSFNSTSLQSRGLSYNFANAHSNDPYFKNVLETALKIAGQNAVRDKDGALVYTDKGDPFDPASKRNAFSYIFNYLAVRKALLRSGSGDVGYMELLRRASVYRGKNPRRSPSNVMQWVRDVTIELELSSSDVAKFISFVHAATRYSSFNTNDRQNLTRLFRSLRDAVDDSDLPAQDPVVREAKDNLKNWEPDNKKSVDEGGQQVISRRLESFINTYEGERPSHLRKVAAGATRLQLYNEAIRVQSTDDSTVWTTRSALGTILNNLFGYLHHYNLELSVTVKGTSFVIANPSDIQRVIGTLYELPNSDSTTTNVISVASVRKSLRQAIMPEVYKLFTDPTKLGLSSNDPAYYATGIQRLGEFLNGQYAVGRIRVHTKFAGNLNESVSNTFFFPGAFREMNFKGEHVLTRKVSQEGQKVDVTEVKNESFGGSGGLRPDHVTPYFDRMVYDFDSTSGPTITLPIDIGDTKGHVGGTFSQHDIVQTRAWLRKVGWTIEKKTDGSHYTFSNMFGLSDTDALALIRRKSPSLADSLAANMKSTGRSLSQYRLRLSIGNKYDVLLRDSSFFLQGEHLNRQAFSSLLELTTSNRAQLQVRIVNAKGETLTLDMGKNSVITTLTNLSAGSGPQSTFLRWLKGESDSRLSF